MKNTSSNRPSPRRRLFWDLWPSRSTATQEEALPEMKFNEQLSSDPTLSDQEVQQRVTQLQSSLAHLRSTPAEPFLPRRSRYWRAAAAVSGLLMMGALLFLLNDHESNQYWTTDYGETRELWLPDSSRVTLNANSSLHHASNWEEGVIREVYLEGEAFFEVQKQTTKGGGVKFVVHTDDVDVEVLGTRFNVWKRAAKTQVMLQEGSVRLRIEKHPEEIVMQSGELVEFSPETGPLVQQVVDPKEYDSWKDHQLIFDGRPLSELIGKIKEIYGLPVVASVRAQQIKLTGTFPTNNLDDLLTLLSTSTGLQVERGNNVIRLRE